MNSRQLGMHFSKHGSEFGAADAGDYEQRADAFLTGVRPAHVQECRRSGGDVIRFDPMSDEYGVIDSTGTVRTYFRPVPCATLNPSLRAAAQRAGQCHGAPDNLTYFRNECLKY